MTLVDFVRLASTDGIILEFGVAEGGSITTIAKAVPDRLVVGFDSFKGLPEDWRADDGTLEQPKGRYACPIPSVPENVLLVVGLFQNTLPAFLSICHDSVAFLHIDCDLYSSTKFVLDQLSDRLDGAIVVFDEIEGHPPYVDHEGRAFKEFLNEQDYSAEFLGRQWERGAAYRLMRTICF